MKSNSLPYCETQQCSNDDCDNNGFSTFLLLNTFYYSANTWYAARNVRQTSRGIVDTISLICKRIFGFEGLAIENSVNDQIVFFPRQPTCLPHNFINTLHGRSYAHFFFQKFIDSG
jgi:hypothetical protein